MKKAKFIYTILVVLMVVATGIKEVSAQTRVVLHNVVAQEYHPVSDANYAAAIKGELKGFFYGGKAGLARKIEMSHYLFNFSDNKRNFKTLPFMNGKHPVTEIRYLDANGKYVERDTITIEGTIMLLTDYNLAYGYNAGFNVDSIDTDFCHDNGDYDWHRRAVKPGELRRMLVGVTLYSKGPTGCGNDIDLPAEKLGQSERLNEGNNDVTGAIPGNTNPMVFNAGGPNGATARINIDSVLLANNATGGGNIIILPAVVNSTSSVTNSGNGGGGSTSPSTDGGSFRETDYQDVRNHGYDNVPYEYNARYYQWQQPGGQPQYVYRSNGQWLYAAGGFAVGVVVGALLDNLFTTCNNNQATGCGYGYNGSGGVVVNNYNYNNNTVNTGGNPSPNPNPTGGPVSPPNGNGGPVSAPNGPAVGNNGNPQNGGNRNQGYVYQPQGNVQNQSRPAQQNAQQAPPQSRGNANVNPAPARPVPQPQARPTVQSRPASRPAPAPSGVVVRGNSVPRAR